MYSENGLNLKLEEVLAAIGSCDVMVLGFMHLPRRVLFDTRPGPGGPLFRIVQQVRSPKERFEQLRRLRPGAGDPERYLFLQWPLGISTILESGVWQRVVDRCVAAAPERGQSDCNGILERLRRLDAREDREAIHGSSYRTYWPPQKE